MVRYETLILARPEITEDELAHIEQFFYKHIPDSKGKVSIFDKWGKYPLAYPIKKNTYGTYVLVRYELNDDMLNTFAQELDSFFKIKCNEYVLRSATVKLKANAPTTYIKPESLETTRSTSVESFLKDNKMEGLLNTVDLEPVDEAEQEESTHAPSDIAKN